MTTPVSTIKINRHIKSKRIDIKNDKKDSKKDLSKFFGVTSPTTKYATKKENKPISTTASKEISDLFLNIADDENELFPIEMEVLNEPSK